MQSPDSAGAVREEGKSDHSVPLFDLYALYLQTIEKVSDRRSALNTWMISLLNAMIALDAVIAKLSTEATRGIDQLLVPLAGVVTTLTWLALLNSYKSLNGAKFKVLFALEDAMGADVFRLEQKHYKETRRKGFTTLEKYVPIIFLAIFLLFLGARIFITPLELL